MVEEIMLENKKSNGSEVKKRRGSVTEEAEEKLLDAKSEDLSKKKSKSKKKSLKESLSEIGREVYNSDYREFLTRDSKGWFKLSLFYFIFYTCLSAFFCFLLFIFYQMIDSKTPNYFYKESVMHYKEINPGMGFRPQVYIYIVFLLFISLD